MGIVRITQMVAEKILARGLYPQGLYRSLFGVKNRDEVKEERSTSPPEASSMTVYERMAS